ncbi:corticotropin-releasing factor-binding protein [Procambarus clarkii]|uniref:corticotropin-releasing factor-binding protein n=1 Tax=Procambarus clarkii TaxID=6728 RepID=UPI001E6781E2|nr:corticotropin-releasing factor-binding protein-like [Procambarus clarkii]
MLLALLVAAGLLCCAHTSPVTKSGDQKLELNPSIRAKRNSRIIEECMLVGLEEGTYYYKSRGAGDVCGVYLLSQPDQAVQVSFDYLDVDCDTEGLVSFVDGWELGGELFPSEVDAPLEGRVHEFCGRLKKKTLKSTGNAAVIQYRVPSRGDGFRITVRYVRNPAPCNILVDDMSGVYTLRNHGRRSNCSITTIFPATVSIVQLAVGINGVAIPNRAVETGVLSRCEKRGSRDYVQIGGASGLDVTKMEVEDSVCGMDSNPRLPASHIVCGMTTARMVSSGLTDNSITLAISQISDLDIMPTLMCELPL